MGRHCIGSTLIEHLIAMAVTALLAGVAVPTYTAQLRRGWIVDATTTLATYAGRLEASFDSNGNYGVAACSVAAPTGTDQWTFSCTVQAAGQGFLVTATGQNTMAGYAYTLNEASSRNTTAYPAVSGARTCWLIQGTEC